MSSIETGTPRSEWLSKYRDHCVLLALQSMLTQVLGRPCLAPESTYQLRQLQVEEVHRRREQIKPFDSSLDALWDFFFQEMINDKNLITAVIKEWTGTDAQMEDQPTSLEFRFIDKSLAELKVLAIQGIAVGVIYSYSEFFEPIGHIFHLKYQPGNILSLDNVSDRGIMRMLVCKQMLTGQLNRYIESTRRRCGYSGLIVSKQGARMGS